MFIFQQQQQQGPGQDIAEALTDVHGSVWVLIAIGVLFVTVRFLAKAFQTAVIAGVLVGLYVLMNAPGLSGSGVEERWNDVKAKAEAFWNAEDIPFDRQG